MKDTNNIMLGQYLREQRELRGMSIEEAAMETHISKKYIEALENNEYASFPAEMYIVGFLTSYIEVLELDEKLALSMYKRAIIKEQEIPLESLYNFQSQNSSNISIKKYVRFGILGILVCGLIGVAYYFISQIDMSKQTTFVEKSAITQISLAELESDDTITVGVVDTLVIVDNDGQNLFMVEFSGKEKNKNLINFKIGRNQYSYKKGDILNTDISGNGVNDLKLEIVSIDSRDVELSLDYTHEVQVATFFDIAPYRESVGNTIPIAVVTNVNTFNATVTATRPAWLAYQADTVDEKEHALEANGIIRFSFIDGVKLSLGNAGAVTITFGEFTNVIRGGIAGESSQSLFYKKTEGNISTLYRAQLK